MQKGGGRRYGEGVWRKEHRRQRKERAGRFEKEWGRRTEVEGRRKRRRKEWDEADEYVE